MAQSGEDSFEAALESPSRMRSSAQMAESSKLYRDISPSKVFSNNVKSKASNLPDLFKQKNALASLRPLYLSPTETEEVPDSDRAPRLLAR